MRGDGEAIRIILIRVFNRNQFLVLLPLRLHRRRPSNERTTVECILIAHVFYFPAIPRRLDSTGSLLNLTHKRSERQNPTEKTLRSDLSDCCLEENTRGALPQRLSAARLLRPMPE